MLKCFTFKNTDSLTDIAMEIAFVKITKNIFTILVLSFHVGVGASATIRQQAKLPAQAACCTYTSATTQSFTNPPFPSIPGAVAVSPQGCLSLMAFHGTLVSYEINSACNLVGPTYSNAIFSSTGLYGLTYSPDGSCLIAFGESPTGGPSVAFLSSLPGCTFSSPLYTGVTFATAVAASSSCVTVAQGTNAYALSGLLVNCDSSLSNTLTGQNFNNAAYSPDGSCLAVLTTSGTVATFPILSECTLGIIQPGISVANAVDLAFSPDGSCLVVLQGDPADQVSSFSVTDCMLSGPISTVSTDNSPTQISFSPSGQCFAVAASKGDNAIVDIYSSILTVLLHQHLLTQILTQVLDEPSHGHQVVTAYFSLMTDIFPL